MFTPNVPIFITLHEFIYTHLLRRASCLSFALRSKAMLFTTEYERRAFSAWFPWTKGKSTIIPIGSNIPLAEEVEDRDPLGVFYFGLIRPDKGLEEFVELAKLARDTNRPYRFEIVGATHPRFDLYYKSLKQSAEGLPITWHLDLPAEQVAMRLASLRFAYMPYPDGASERRASLLAALGNGAVVITTQVLQTTDELSAVVRFASDPSQALSLLDRLASDAEQTDILSITGRKYASQFSWRSIAQAHRRLYEQIL
jgi:glycosyltransferase involved in cell wall biosynthesis